MKSSSAPCWRTAGPLRRHDHWVRLLEIVRYRALLVASVCLVGLAGNPQAEEQCCDAWVVWVLPRAARAYATALMETLTSFRDQSVLPWRKRPSVNVTI